MKKLILRLICRVRGHRYPGLLFTNYTLSCCVVCGREVADRTFDDILPVPDDYDWFDDEWA